MARLDFYQNGQLFLKMRLEARSMTIGRSNDCDLMLPHPKISRRHAALEPSGDTWFLDNKGMNGTRVNAELVSDRKKLEFGDRIYIESYIIIFAGDDDEDEYLLESTGTAFRLPPQKLK